MNEDDLHPPRVEEFPAEVRRVMDDYERRTLNALEGPVSRLIHLAALRDHNTGKYSHYGLETRYSEEAVDEGLRALHHKVFNEAVRLSLEQQTREMIDFYRSQPAEKIRMVQAWQRLKSYQILLPEQCHPLARDLFTKNFEIILRILEHTELWPLLDNAHGDSDNLP
jgi:hypothetical protein